MSWRTAAGGVSIPIRKSIRCVRVHDEQEESLVYMICEPATRYYTVMTHSERMPVLIGEML